MAAKIPPLLLLVLVFSVGCLQQRPSDEDLFGRAISANDSRLCAQIRARELRAGCQLATAVCPEKEGAAKGECYLRAGERANSSELCGRAAPAEFAMACDAIVSGDTSACPTWGPVKEICFSEIALRTAREGVCGALTGAQAAHCKARVLTDELACGEIADLEKRYACMADVAALKKDAGICDAIPIHTEPRWECIAAVAAERRDSRLCDSIYEFNGKAKCGAMAEGDLVLCEVIGEPKAHEDCVYETYYAGWVVE